MPHNNRMMTSGSLKTHGIWKDTIGHDPYKGEGDADGADGSPSADLKQQSLELMERVKMNKKVSLFL